MRYYRIELKDGKGNPLTPPSFQAFANAASSPGVAPAFEKGVITSLLPDGSTNPAALNIELDIPQLAEHIGDTRGYVRIYGLGLKDIFQSYDLNPPSQTAADSDWKQIAVYAGMSKGLPLADPNQRGLLAKGRIWQAFGNWLGTDQTLDLIIGPPVGQQQVPANCVFIWQHGQKLADALAQTLSQAFPWAKQDLAGINPNRVWKGTTAPSYYRTLTELAGFVQAMTSNYPLGQDDPGVGFYVNGSTIKVIELKPTQAAVAGQVVKQINFQDLLGQLTWSSPLEVTCKVVMRGDLEVGGYVSFPKETVAVSSVTAAALPAIAGTARDADKLGPASGATFFIKAMQHWGNYRQADAMSWNTTLWLQWVRP